MRIDGREIGVNKPPYLIAEISANHNGSLSRALDLIAAAKRNGASAVKLQTYTADTLTIQSAKSDFQINGGIWDGRTLYDLYQQAHTPWEWHQELFDAASEIGITIFSSPFDASAVELLERLNAPAYKIASFEIVDLELIRIAASTGKPLIISTGLASLEEITEAYDVAMESGAEDVALLHCLSSYPAPASEYKLNTIEKLRSIFDSQIGLSDHTVGNDVALAAISLGATIIEKHFTWDTTSGGPDDSFSMDPSGLKSLRESADRVWESLGFDNFAIQPSERDNIRFRRSLYFVKDVKRGEMLSRDHVRSIRPGYGVAPKFLKKIIGKNAPVAFYAGDPVTKEVLDQLC
ncbi:pseudaminic acid synthase [Aquiluna borgnonia]|uniref:Pseudaminic acid synthase n=2 Tax=Aquiluna borgnonia TaxID=2499157 RepID=A0A7D4TJS8_9MICO|nr:pseudaminic acid synthase [Aquiluna borgnonia]